MLAFTKDAVNEFITLRKVAQNRKTCLKHKSCSNVANRICLGLFWGRGRFSRCSSVQLMNNFWMHNAKKSPVVTSAHSRYSGKGGRMARVGFKGQVACSRKKIKSTT